jgi:5-methylthioadenosine/S-adenosylhomocysteine deaminase
MTLLRGLADDLRLDVWLMGYMMPVEREFVSPEFVTLGTKLGCAEMIRSGVTCFADMYYFEDAIARAAADAGMRALCGQTVLRFPAPDAKSYEDSLLFAREFIEKWHGHPLIVPAPRRTRRIRARPTSCARARSSPSNSTCPSTFTCPKPRSRSRTRGRDHGMPVVPWVKKQGLFDAKVLAAHCVHVDDGEIRALKNVNAAWRTIRPAT